MPGGYALVASIDAGRRRRRRRRRRARSSTPAARSATAFKLAGWEDDGDLRSTSGGLLPNGPADRTPGGGRHERGRTVRNARTGPSPADRGHRESPIPTGTWPGAVCPTPRSRGSACGQAALAWDELRRCLPGLQPLHDDARRHPEVSAWSTLIRWDQPRRTRQRWPPPSRERQHDRGHRPRGPRVSRRARLGGRHRTTEPAHYSSMKY
jgi:hypothetical protein